MAKYHLSKDQLVRIVTDETLPLPSFQTHGKAARELLYHAQNKREKSCCCGEWNVIKGFVPALIASIKSGDEEKKLFKDYMFDTYGIPKEQTLLFFFRLRGEAVYETV